MPLLLESLNVFINDENKLNNKKFFKYCNDLELTVKVKIIEKIKDNLYYPN